MNAPVVTYRLETSKPHVFSELDRVRLIHEVAADDGTVVDEGAEGTIVGIWADGIAYEVEFATALITVDAGNLLAAQKRE